METVKTAISLNKNLFEQADELAKEMRVSRSRLFVLALEEFLKKNENQFLLEQLNSTYEDAFDENEKKQNASMKTKQRQMAQDETW